MPSPRDASPRPLVGYGAFGRLIARHLALHARIRVYDPALPPAAIGPDAAAAGIEAVGRCPTVILATPVSGLAGAVAALAPHLRPGTLVVDVGSVKVVPAAVMREVITHAVWVARWVGVRRRALARLLCGAGFADSFSGWDGPSLGV